MILFEFQGHSIFWKFQVIKTFFFLCKYLCIQFKLCMTVWTWSWSCTQCFYGQMQHVFKGDQSCTDNIVTIAEFLCKLIFLILLVSGQGEPTVSLSPLFHGVPGKWNYPPDKNCENLPMSVHNWCHLIKNIKLSWRLPILVY